MKMVKYKIIDNFLNYSDFTELSKNILPKSAGMDNKNVFSWLYVDKQVKQVQGEKDEQERFKKVTDIEPLSPIHQWFFSNILCAGGYQSQALQYLGPLLNKIEFLAPYMIQANLTVQQEKRGRSPFHIDYFGEPLKHTSMITSIFYVNTTNGPTILEDGTEIECRANRLVSYPYNTYHAGVLCTDQPYRIVINLNYFKEMEFS